MKKIILLAIALLVVSCSVHKVTDPALNKPYAKGNPNEGDGGGNGGGGSGMTVNLGDNPNGELGDTLTVHVYINGVTDTTKGVQVTVRADAGLTIVSSSLGSYLATDSNAIFWSGFNSDGSYTLIGTPGPGYCSPTTGYGTMFNIKVFASEEGVYHLTLGASPPGAVTPSPTVRKCQTNGDLSVAYGNTNSTITYVNP